MRFTGKVRTLRGKIKATGGKASQQLILNDQLINDGLRVTGFFMWPTQVDHESNRQFTGILSYAELVNSDVAMDAGDNTQIGWAFQSNTASIAAPNPQVPSVAPSFSGYFNQLIDPDHIINRDLFISLRLADNFEYNYLIVCEFIELTDDEAIVTIIKENSQSVE